MNLSKIKTLIPAPESAFVVDLDNDYSSVALDVSGSTIAVFDMYVKPMAYYGATDILSECSIGIANSANVNNNIQITTTAFKTTGIRIRIEAGKSLSAVNDIVFALTHPVYGRRETTFTLGGVRSGSNGAPAVTYDMLPSLSVFSFARTASGGLTPASRNLTMTIRKTTGSTTEEKTISDCGLTVRYSTSAMPQSKTSGTEFGSSLTVYSNDDFTHVYLAAFNASGVLVDRETIPVVKDGANGQNGIIYYITASVGSLDADEQGTVTTPNLSIVVRRWKKEGSASAALTTDGKFKIYKITGSTKTQFGPTELSTEYSFLASMANGADSIQAELTDSSGNALCTPLSIPVKKKGDTGEEGKTGNGITGETTYYLATTMATGVTRNTDTSLWTTSYQQATPDKPYVWRYTVTYYRDTSPTYTDCELIFSYSSGANPNLLEQTNFSSLLALDSWESRGYISSLDDVSRSNNLQIATGTQAHNAIRDVLSYAGDVVGREEMLQQLVTGPKRKLEPNTWYTLSFWTKGSQSRRMGIYTGGAGYSIGAERHIYLEAGRRYRVTAYGYINRNGNSSVELRTYVWGPLDSSSPWSNQNSVAITSSGYTTASFDFTPTATGMHGIDSYVFPDAFRTGNEYGYIAYYEIFDVTCLFVTHIYPNVIDTSVQGYVDGERRSLAGDGYAIWPESSSWVRHTYTFKTRGNLDVTARNHVLWRIRPCIFSGLSRDVYICMPKLEVGMQATGYLSNEATLHTGQPRNRRWALNTAYQSGAPDEQYDDSVLIEGKGFYHCIKAHVSTEGNRPFTGSSWQTYWEEGVKIENLATDFFLADKAVIRNLVAEMIKTGYEGMPHIEAQGSEFKVYGNGKYPIVELAVNDAGKGVLRFLNEDTGAIYYDLGPEGITKTLAQDEKITSSDKYQVIGLTDNSDINVLDAASYFSNIFNRTKAANNVTMLYTYEAKIVANQFDPGQYCATADDARNANKRVFLVYAETSATGRKYIRDIAPFTGLVCYSWHAASNGGLQEYSSPYALLGYYVYEAEAIPDDYDEDLQGGEECNFMTDSNGYYVDPVCCRTVFHILDGKWNGSVTLYYNKSKFT